VPAAQLNPGTTYEWKVRCACSLSPLVVTPFSTLENFSWPALRVEASIEAPGLPGAGTPSPDLYPNPATAWLNIQWPESSLGNDWVLEDMQGKTWTGGRADNALQQVDISQLPAGIYRLRQAGNVALTLGKVVVLR
jgi:hypothetical protein